MDDFWSFDWFSDGVDAAASFIDQDLLGFDDMELGYAESFLMGDWGSSVADPIGGGTWLYKGIDAVSGLNWGSAANVLMNDGESSAKSAMPQFSSARGRSRGLSGGTNNQFTAGKTSGYPGASDQRVVDAWKKATNSGNSAVQKAVNGVNRNIKRATTLSLSPATIQRIKRKV